MFAFSHHHHHHQTNMAVEQSRESTEQTTAGPQSALEALKAFKEVQERRVAHWKEYDEALEHYERTNLNVENTDTAENEEESTSQTQRIPHRCGPQTNSHSSNHYHSVELPMTDAIFSKILALVTSGLLDCSHSARAIETELKTALHRTDLARLVGQVQDQENIVLRKVVERDQNKRIAKIEGRDLNDVIQQSNQQINQARERIQEKMEDIAAEMAEL